MTDGDHDNDKQSVLDRVDDAVVANPNSPPGSSAKLTRGWGPRILSQQSDCASQAIASLRFDLAQLTRSGRSELDPVAAHAQPRSCFTCSQGMLAPSSAIAVSKAEMSSISSSASINSP